MSKFKVTEDVQIEPKMMYFDAKSCVQRFLSVKNGFSGQFHLYIAGFNTLRLVFSIEKLKKHDLHEFSTEEHYAKKIRILTEFSSRIEFKWL